MLPSEMLRLTCGNARQRIQALNSKGFEYEDFAFRMVKLANVAIAKACYLERNYSAARYLGGRTIFYEMISTSYREEDDKIREFYIPDASVYPLSWMIAGGH